LKSHGYAPTRSLGNNVEFAYASLTQQPANAKNE
jgi:hypothetical protein